MTMHFIQFPELLDAAGKEIAIVPIRLVRNADSRREAINLAIKHVVKQMPTVTFVTVMCLDDNDEIFQYEESDGVVKVKAGDTMTFEIPSSAVLEAKSEFLN